MDEKKWYYAEKKERKGPFTEEQLIDFIQTGTITAATLLWTKGFENWSKAEDTEMSVHLETGRQSQIENEFARLAKLKESGVLTEEEFQTAKALVLKTET